VYDLRARAVDVAPGRRYDRAYRFALDTSP
jgi:hypothetical protein